MIGKLVIEMSEFKILETKKDRRKILRLLLALWFVRDGEDIEEALGITLNGVLIVREGDSGELKFIPPRTGGSWTKRPFPAAMVTRRLQDLVLDWVRRSKYDKHIGNENLGIGKFIPLTALDIGEENQVHLETKCSE